MGLVFFVFFVFLSKPFPAPDLALHVNIGSLAGVEKPD